MSPKPPKSVLRLRTLGFQARAARAERARLELARAPVVPLQAPSFDDQRRALRLMLDGLRDAVGSRSIGDCFAFGLRNEVSASALLDCLPEVGLARVRRFSWACSLPSDQRGGADFGWGELTAPRLREVRSRHQVRRVSLVLVGNDFVPTSLPLLDMLEPLLADEVLWVVCNQSAVPRGDVVLTELAGQRAFSVLPVGTFGAAWVAVRMRRVQMV